MKKFPKLRKVKPDSLKIPKNHKLVKKFKQFFLDLEPKDKVAILHHTDPDGVCSGVIMAKLVERMRGKQPNIRMNQLGSDVTVSAATIKRLKKRKANKIIITDLVVDQNPKTAKALSRFADVLIIDHHNVYHNLNSKRITFLKPQLLFGNIDTTVYCAAKFCYDLALLMTDVSDLDWIAAAGAIGDISYPYWPGFMKKVYKRHKIVHKKDPFKSVLGKAPILISEVECFNWRKIGKVFEALYRSKNYRQFLKSDLVKYQKRVRKDIQHYIKNFKKLAQIHPKKQLAILEIKSRFYIKSNISTQLSFLYPRLTIITYQRLGDTIGISARRQDRKVRVNDLLVKAVKGLKSAGAGGHIPAAAGRIRCKQKKKFIENLLAAA